MRRIRDILTLLIATLALPFATSVFAQSSTPPDEIRFDEDAIIDATIDGVPVRLEVQPGLAGPPIVNPDVALKLLRPNPSRRSIDFGSLVLPGSVADAVLDFGYGPVQGRVAWSPNEASTEVDGVIGVHDLPYRRVTYQFADTGASESVQRFKLKRRRSRDFTRIGTEIKIEKKKLFMIFALHVEPNVVTASTANFLATHQEGGFVPDSNSAVDLMFGVRVRTRDMKLAYPVEFGGLRLDRFAVRIWDHGNPDKVGEIDKDDPRFAEDRGILVSRRKRQGKPDWLTRIGRTQLAHCSRLTFDLEEMIAELSCDNSKLVDR